MSVAWLEIAGTDQISKMNCFDYFRRAPHLGCLISFSYATVCHCILLYLVM